MRTYATLFACIAALLFSLPAFAKGPSTPKWVAQLRHGGYVIVLRHGATNSNQADGPNTQRQLSDQGRSEIKSIGEAMHKLKIPVGQVHTSQLDRAVETGKLLGYGDGTASADFTEMGMGLSPDENSRRTKALRTLIGTKPPAGTNVIIVTHKPNIVEALGKDWLEVHDGEASIFKPDGKGGFKPVARVLAADWTKLVPAVK
jgi:phosphohistidine phosphatase SixA